MLSIPGAVKIFLAVAPTDLRKSHDGLAALVEHVLEADPFSGQLFVFRNKRADRVKHHERGHGDRKRQVEQQPVVQPEVEPGLGVPPAAEISELLESVEFFVGGLRDRLAQPSEPQRPQFL